MKKQDTTLALFEIFTRYTDEKNGKSKDEIINILEEEYHILKERRSIDREFEKFQNTGFTINSIKAGRTNYYYLDRDNFTKGEIRLLVDLTKDSRILAKNDQIYLEQKLRCTQMEITQDELDEEILDIQMRKNKALDIFRNIEIVTSAIQEGNKIVFRMTDYNPDGSSAYRREGKFYKVSPYYLVLRNGFYYVIGNDERFDDLSNYRLDRIVDLEINIERITTIDAIKNFDLEHYLSVSIDMFQSHEEIITLEIDKSRLRFLFDTFEKNNIRLIEERQNSYIYELKLDASIKNIDMFISCADFVRVLGPASFVDEIKEKVKIINSVYK